MTRSVGFETGYKKTITDVSLNCNSQRVSPPEGRENEHSFGTEKHVHQMTLKRTAESKNKSIDFNNESNIFGDKSVDVTGQHLTSHENMISPNEFNHQTDVIRFMEETDKLKKTIGKIKEIWD